MQVLGVKYYAFFSRHFLNSAKVGLCVFFTLHFDSKFSLLNKFHSIPFRFVNLLCLMLAFM